MEGCTPPAYACLAKVVGLFNDGKCPDVQARRQFWQEVAYYSFVQTKVIGDKPRKRPTVDQWEEGKRIFPSVLNLLMPEFILVLGKELGDHLPGAREVAILKNEATGERRNCNVYETPEGKALALCINHPASGGGFAYKKWMPRLRIALERRATDPVSSTIRLPIFQLVKLQEIHQGGSMEEHMIDGKLLFVGQEWAGSRHRIWCCFLDREGCSDDTGTTTVMNEHDHQAHQAHQAERLCPSEYRGGHEIPTAPH